jgi:hypothetical protein
MSHTSKVWDIYLPNTTKLGIPHLQGVAHLTTKHKTRYD